MERWARLASSRLQGRDQLGSKCDRGQEGESPEGDPVPVARSGETTAMRAENWGRRLGPAGREVTRSRVLGGPVA